MSLPMRALAFDFGASSGRAVIGEFDGEKITLNEVHRFSNEPVEAGGTVYWDVLRLFYEIKQGLIKAKDAGGFDFIGIDTWGVDFGLIDEYGCLMENPVHYRDLRTKDIPAEVFKLVPQKELYEKTGIQFMELNTIFQLYSLRLRRPRILERADKLLFMPDLLSYLLTGVKATEYSIATTSQLVDINSKEWSSDILERLEIPKRLFTDIVPSGTVVGALRGDICAECAVPSVPVIAVCGHDTQSAISAVPSVKKDFVFISSGTWSLFGTETESPIINEMSFEMNITNEGGYGGATGFLKNIVGLWLIQESRRQWNREGNSFSYADLERLALEEEPFKCFIDPDSPEFVPMGDIPARVADFCRRTGQYVPETVGEIVRCIYESLAMKYRQTFEKIKSCTGKDYEVIHVIGGGVKDTLLCGMTASSCERAVMAGPIEATVFGNISVGLLASGAVKSIAQAREIVKKSDTIKEYKPGNTEEWRKAYEKFLCVTRQNL